MLLKDGRTHSVVRLSVMLYLVFLLVLCWSGLLGAMAVTVVLQDKPIIYQFNLFDLTLHAVVSVISFYKTVFLNT